MARQITLKGQLVSIGDTVNISQQIKEGEKERTQPYEGVVIAIKGNPNERTITVRKIAVGGIGVERIFPLDLPSIERVRIVKSTNVHRSKLYYLRERIGKAALKLGDIDNAGVRMSEGENLKTDEAKQAKPKVTTVAGKTRSRKPRRSGRAGAS